MAKKEKKGGAGGGVQLNQTGKFMVLDAPGVTQPEIAAPVAPAVAPASSQDGGVQGRRAKASTGVRIEDTKKLIGGESFVHRTKDPEFLKTREDVYAKIKERRLQEFALKTPVPITVTMPDGNVLDKSKEGEVFQTWKTTPYDVAKFISQGLADSSTVARVTFASYAADYSPAEDGMEGEDTMSDAMADAGLDQDDNNNTAGKTNMTLLWDMMRPLVGPVAKMEFLKFDNDKDAKTVFWHSSAHMMGEAMENLWGCKLTIGPPLAGGFYYDSFMGTDAFREEDCKSSICIYLFIENSHAVFGGFLFLTHPTPCIFYPTNLRQTGRAGSRKDYQTKATV
jgi:threonyl-tRNA synthetase